MRLTKHISEDKFSQDELRSILQCKSKWMPTDHNSAKKCVQTALNWANENRDDLMINELLKLEKKCHTTKEEGLECFRANLSGDDLLPWTISAFSKLYDQPSWFKAIFTVLLTVVILSFFPVFFDFYSDIMLVLSYQQIYFDNEFNMSELWSCSGSYINSSCIRSMGFEVLVTGELPELAIRDTYKQAFSFTIVLIIFSSLFYFICAVYYPVPKSKDQTLRWIGKKLFWPMQHCVHHLHALHTNQPSRFKSHCARSNEIWMTFKTVEIGIEASFQLGLQLWLLRPFLSVISVWPSEELVRHAFNGMFYFITLGKVSACYVENALFKIMFTVILLSGTLTKMKSDKPGMSFSWWLFFSILAQVVARIFSFISLVLLSSPLGFGNLIFILYLIHSFLVIIILNIQAILNERSNFTPYTNFKSWNLIRFCVSVCSSWIVLIDLKDSRSKVCRRTFLANTLFFFLILTENIILVWLPDWTPDLYPPLDCFTAESLKMSKLSVVLLEIVGISLHIIHYKFWHPWSDLIEPLNGKLTIWVCWSQKVQVVQFRAPWTSQNTR